jgi:hypothetical protein
MEGGRRTGAWSPTHNGAVEQFLPPPPMRNPLRSPSTKMLIPSRIGLARPPSRELRIDTPSAELVRSFTSGEQRI